MLFNFKQASYKGVSFKPLNSPFTRFNLTQKYFGLAYRLNKHPQLHATVSLSSTLLNQLEKNYLERLKPNINLANEDFDVEKFRLTYLEKSDPWIDLLVTNSWEMDRKQRDYLYNWSGKQNIHCFSVDESVLEKFPEYIELLPDDMQIGKFKGVKSRKDYTVKERAKLKFLFNLVSFDPVLLQGAVKLPIRNEQYEWAYSKLHKWVKWEKGDPDNPDDDKYLLAKEITEKDCQQLVVEIYKVLASVIPAYKKVIYDERKERGQVELLLSPGNNGILSLLQDSDAAKQGQPGIELPSRYFFPEDASWQLRLGIADFKTRFNKVPPGLWVEKGTISNNVIKLIANEGVQWIPLHVNEKMNSDKNKMCGVYYKKDTENNILASFLPVKTLSVKLNKYSADNNSKEKAVNFLNEIKNYAPAEIKEPVITVLNSLDESGDFSFSLQRWSFWENLFNYADSLYTVNEIITITPAEYLNGNKKRKISEHPVSKLPLIEDNNLLNNYNNWIGEDKQNLAWEYLTNVREMLTEMNLQYNPDHPNTWIKKAWEEIYAAQNGEWFRLYKNNNLEMNTFCLKRDDNFRERLSRIYYYLNRAGFEIDVPDFPAVFQEEIVHDAAKPFSSDPTINGRQDKIWLSEGGYLNDKDGINEEDLIERVFWGYDEEKIYLAIKSKKSKKSSLKKAFVADSLIMVIYSIPESKKRLTYDEKNSKPGILKTAVKNSKEMDIFKFRKDSTSVTPPDTSMAIGVKNRFLELSIPIEKIKNKNKRKRFFIQLWKEDKLIDYFPNAGLIEIGN